MPIMSFAEETTDITSPRVAELIAQKQAKMKKLEKCKGTTKNLKIAGLSTLGVTAVGVAANVAEAVILKEEKGKLGTATSDAVKALCENTTEGGKKGLGGSYDATKRECSVKGFPDPLPEGITCNDARTECSSGNTKVKVKVGAEAPAAEAPAEEAPANENAEESAPANENAEESAPAEEVAE